MTPDQQLSILNWQNQPVRIIQEQNIAYIPVMDIASAVGMSKRPLLGILDRNPKEFSSHERDVQISTPGGRQLTKCLDYPGTIGLLFKISTNHLKDDLTRERLLGFRQYMIESKSTPLALPAPKQEPDYNAILNKIKFVNALHELTKWNLLELQREVLREAGMLSLTYHIEPEQKALPAPVKPKGYYTATDIGERIGKSAQEVNQWLYNNQYLIKDDAYEWKLTALGHMYGEERVIEPSKGLLVIRIYWKPTILEKMNVQEKAG